MMKMQNYPQNRTAQKNKEQSLRKRHSFIESEKSKHKEQMSYYI